MFSQICFGVYTNINQGKHYKTRTESTIKMMV